MIFTFGIENIDHRAESGGFAAADRTGNKDESVGIVKHSFNSADRSGEKTQFFKRTDVVGDDAV